MIFQELSALFSFIYSQTSLSKFGKFVNISLDTGCYLVDFIGSLSKTLFKIMIQKWTHKYWPIKGTQESLS